MTDPDLGEALELLASIDARCQEFRRNGVGQEVIDELEKLIAEIRDQISRVGHQRLSWRPGEPLQ